MTAHLIGQGVIEAEVLPGAEVQTTEELAQDVRNRAWRY